MTQEVQQVAEVTQPEVTVNDAAADNPEVAEQEAEKHEETLEEKVARLEKESHGKQRRIDKLAAKNRVNEETASQYRARLEQIHNAQNPNQQQPTQEDRDRAVEVETEAVVAIKVLMREDKDFAENLKTLQEEVGPLTNRQGLPTPLLNVLLERESPTKVVKYLLKNPELAEELRDLSPTKVASKLTLLEEGMKQAPKISKNPEPISPIGQKGRGTVKALEDMSMDEYIKARSTGPNKARWAR